jgi:hypothetical protein
MAKQAVDLHKKTAEHHVKYADHARLIGDETGASLGDAQ